MSDDEAEQSAVEESCTGEESVVSKLKDAVLDLQDENDELADERDKLLHVVNVLKKKLKETLEENESLDADMGDLEQKMEELKDQLDTESKENEALDKTMEKLEKEVAELRRKDTEGERTLLSTKEAHEKELGEFKDKFFNVQAGLQAEKNVLVEKIKQLGAEKAKATSSLDRLTVYKKELDEEIRVTRTHNEKLASTLSSYDSSLGEERENSKQELEKLRQQVASAQKQLASRKVSFPGGCVIRVPFKWCASSQRLVLVLSLLAVCFISLCFDGVCVCVCARVYVGVFVVSSFCPSVFRRGVCAVCSLRVVLVCSCVL
jgi:chromosome segregation ATPase